MMSFKRSVWYFAISIALLFSFVTLSYAKNVTLAWDANTEPDLDGYKVYYDIDSSPPYNGTDANEGNSGEITVDKYTTTITLTGLSDDQTHYFAVTAFDTEDLESDYSNEVPCTLTVTTVGSGSVTLDPPGGNYNADTVVQLEAVADPGWQFSGWSGAITGAGNPATITMSAHKVVTATFTEIPSPQYSLTVNTVGSGSVILNPSDGTYDEDTVVTLTAQAASGWQFSGWSGAITGASNPATITMDAHKVVTATFTEIPSPQYSLTVNTVGSGSVILNPSDGTYDEDTVVTLTAQAASGWQFSGWSGAITGTSNPATITMDSDKALVATFTEVSAIPTLQYSFDLNEEGFRFMDDAFRDTLEPDYAAGIYSALDGYNGGALQVILGGINNEDILDMSGGWQKNFTLDEPTEVILSCRYNLIQASDYESDELSQVLVSIDGILYGQTPNDYVDLIVGNGNGGDPQTTGWRLFQVNLGFMLQGDHTLIIGGYNNKKTSNNEITQILIDDLQVIGASGENSPPISHDQSVTTKVDTEVMITLTGSDADGDLLSYSIVTDPTKGFLSGTAPNLTYTPDPDYVGPDTFTFKATDGWADSNVATVSIAVNSVIEPPRNFRILLK